MDKKVLIVGPKYFGYNESVAYGFNALGWQTEIIDYYEAFPKTVGNFFSYRIFPRLNINYFKNEYIGKLNESILSSIEKEKPDYVLFIKGTFIKKETLEAIKAHSKVILWMMDSIYRYRDAYNNIDYFDAKFMFEESDVKRLKEENIDSIFLPMAADENNYFPMEHTEKDIDVLFVGKLYENRLQMFNRLIKKYPDLNIKIYGQYTALKKPMSFYEYYLTDRKKYFTNSFVSPKELNKLYSRSKIALNIHHAQSQTGCNPRVFEILAAKTFQLVDVNLYIKENFVEKSLLAGYTNEIELFDQIEYYLKHVEERNEIAKNGYANVIANHTFKQRVEVIVNSVEGTL